MVHSNGTRRLEQRPIKLRTGSSRYSTRRLCSRTSLSAARRAIPINPGPGGQSGNSIRRSSPAILLLFAYQVNREAGLAEHDPLVPLAAGHFFAVEKFEQRNRVFAGDAGPFLELRHAEPLSFMLLKVILQGAYGGAVKDQIVAHSDQRALLEQNLQQRPGASRLDSRARQHVCGGRNLQPGRFERGFDLAQSGALIFFKGHPVRSETDDIPLTGQRLYSGNHRVRDAGGGAGEYAAAALLAAHSRGQR